MFKKTSVDGLLSKSKDILNVFTKAKNELAIINESILDEIDKKKSAIKQLEEQERLLTKQESYNLKMMEKIEEFLG